MAKRINQIEVDGQKYVSYDQIIIEIYKFQDIVDAPFGKKVLRELIDNLDGKVNN